jgi:hypothetical protein
MTLQQKLDDYKTVLSGSPPYDALKALIEVFRKGTDLRQSERTRSGNRQYGDSIAPQ